MLHSVSWNGPVPTIGSSSSKNVAFLISSQEDSPQMCSGAMYTHGGRIGALVGSLVIHTSSVGLVASIDSVKLGTI